MRILVRLKLEMLIRVRDFGVAHAALFPLTSFCGELFASIAVAVATLEAHFAEQLSHTGETLGDTESKSVARANLFSELEKINATSRSLGMKIPGMENKFRFPNSRSDQALIAAARAFATDAEPLKAEFIRRNLPATFIEDLQEKIDAFAAIISSRNVHSGSKVQATASIDDVLDEAMLDVRELDPAVENVIGDDKPLLEAWRSARHVERHSSHKPKPTPPIPPTMEEPKSA